MEVHRSEGLQPTQSTQSTQLRPSTKSSVETKIDTVAEPLVHPEAPEDTQKPPPLPMTRRDSKVFAPGEERPHQTQVTEKVAKESPTLSEAHGKESAKLREVLEEIWENSWEKGAGNYNAPLLSKEAADYLGHKPLGEETQKPQVREAATNQSVKVPPKPPRMRDLNQIKSDLPPAVDPTKSDEVKPPKPPRADRPKATTEEPPPLPTSPPPEIQRAEPRPLTKGPPKPPRKADFNKATATKTETLAKAPSTEKTSSNANSEALEPPAARNFQADKAIERDRLMAEQIASKGNLSGAEKAYYKARNAVESDYIKDMSAAKNYIQEKVAKAKYKKGLDNAKQILRVEVNRMAKDTKAKRARENKPELGMIETKLRISAQMDGTIANYEMKAAKRELALVEQFDREEFLMNVKTKVPDETDPIKRQAAQKKMEGLQKKYWETFKAAKKQEVSAEIQLNNAIAGSVFLNPQKKITSWAIGAKTELHHFTGRGRAPSLDSANEKMMRGTSIGYKSSKNLDKMNLATEVYLLKPNLYDSPEQMAIAWERPKLTAHIIDDLSQMHSTLVQEHNSLSAQYGYADAKYAVQKELEANAGKLIHVSELLAPQIEAREKVVSEELPSRQTVFLQALEKYDLYEDGIPLDLNTSEDRLQQLRSSQTKELEEIQENLDNVNMQLKVSEYDHSDPKKELSKQKQELLKEETDIKNKTNEIESHIENIKLIKQSHNELNNFNYFNEVRSQIATLNQSDTQISTPLKKNPQKQPPMTAQQERLINKFA